MKSSMVFHSGELAAQDKAGTRGIAAELSVGKSDSLNFSANHDAFLAAQSFAVISSVDMDSGRVWVTPLFAKEGDLSAVSESEISLSVDCIPEGDVLRNVASKAPLSLLGIDLNRRIRHRISGYAIAPSNKADTRLHFQVNEYSPNCPKYINRRELVPDTDNPDSVVKHAIRHERSTLTESDKAFIQSMDTLWIGSYAPEAGADCNHRGGKPGFIRVTSPTTIEWPEYRGNGMFFTSGNLESYDRAGVTFVDFETGSMIQMTGRAVVDWNYDGQYEGATRLMKFDIEHLVRIDQVTTHRWTRIDYSPYNPVISGTENQRDHSTFPITATLAKVVKESENVKTFRFLAQRRISFLPGQYATFEFNNVPGGSASEIRTWTLSETPNSINGDNTLDITVKRIPEGLVTNWLHDHVGVGLEVNLNGVQGEMTAVQRDKQTGGATVPEHILLLSGGIGMTPNVAMVRGVGAFDLQDQTNITMIHVERFEADLLFQNELTRRATNYPNFSYTNIISSQQGRLSKDMLAELVPDVKQQHAYICGPTLFMADMTEHLVALGVPAANIHTESFEF